MVGFNSENRNAIDVKYICQICNLILRNPVQLDCGHRFCRSCLDTEYKAFVTCHQCPKITRTNDIFYDRGIQNDMKNLHINCYVCHWNGLFKNYKEHLTKYPFNTSHKPKIKNNIMLQLKLLTEKLHELSNNVQILKAITQQLVNQSALYQLGTEEKILSVENTHQNQNDVSSHNGILLWRINKIKDRSNNSESVTSPPFYTSPDGYKLCVRLHFNGNGIGQSTYSSIFIVLMRGDYDAILDWPFNYQVIFCLYNLINQDNHIIESFQSDINLKAFQKPQSDMNVGCGISKFIPRALLEQENSSFIHDDSIYIKVMIRSHPIANFILPYVMKIDLAWPIHIQEEIIQELIQKYPMQSFKLSLTFKSSTL
ncbi:unnamed protein product [Rotaria socialis]|uniref:Uncharacterized protein n=1 Tax=Rotaria socialis TaxID=392032 RepID=A0A821DHS4_9BILA|nr:unnamed protein product [Rotaria socialis]CAF4621767.1 unnamed protein product [Rotaria socialis]